ncbi:MAG: PadR family transcriptional regulator [Dehalococcoidia bacterium]|jgi:DNA-binding PadR family transcriptional regulator|nr:PadR family transcriptional regulator [Dehalococcoidia bacterium]
MTTAPEKTGTGTDLTDEKYWDMLNRKSVSRFFLLAALSDRPLHGYELKRSIGQCCPGAEPTDAMIYPTLKILLEGGYIASDVVSDGTRQRKVCSLTPKGEAAYAAAARAWAKMLPWLQQCVAGAGEIAPELMIDQKLTDQPVIRVWT